MLILHCAELNFNSAPDLILHFLKSAELSVVFFSKYNSAGAELTFFLASNPILILHNVELNCVFFVVLCLTKQRSLILHCAELALGCLLKKS